MLVAGIDCGKEGALALIDGAARSVVQVWDMPTYWQQVGKAKRERVDPVALLQMVEVLHDCGCSLAVIEDPGDRPGQAHLVKLGIAVGFVHMACVAAGVPFQIVPAKTWKLRMGVPADKLGAVQRADAVFPPARPLFRGKRGGMMDGRAEAALIALYGWQYILNPTAKAA